MLTLASIITLVFWGLALKWIMDLERKQCECSKDWRRDYMKYFFIAAILFQFAILSKNLKIVKSLAMPMGLATLVYIGVSLSYIISLRKKQCGCSQSNERMALLVYSSVLPIFIGLGVYSKLG